MLRRSVELALVTIAVTPLVGLALALCAVKLGADVVAFAVGR